MNELRLGPKLTLPLDAVTKRIAFLGNPGSGKTHAATLLAEQMHAARAQFIVLDPVGIWWGLRLGGDGKSPGLNIPVFGGLHGDLPLEAGAGRIIADVVADHSGSAIIDVSQFETHVEKARFCTAFIDRLFYRKKLAPSAIHCFLEEAQEFIPQVPEGADEAKMLNRFLPVIKIGRNFGFGISVISQRPQEVNKKGLNLTELVFAFQLTGTHEREAVAKWVSQKGVAAEGVKLILPTLERGTAHAWSPSWLKISETFAINDKLTFKASQTPEVGQSRAATELAPIDIEVIRGKLAKAVEQFKSNDPDELKKEIASLKMKLAAADKGQGFQIPKGQVLVDACQLDSTRLRIDELRSAFSTAQFVLAGITTPGIQAAVGIERVTPSSVLIATPLPERTASVSDRSDAQLRILDALQWFESGGLQAPTRIIVAIAANVSPLSSAYTGNLSALIAAEKICYPAPGCVSLLPRGYNESVSTLEPASLEKLQWKWLQYLGVPMSRIVEVLIGVYPKDLSREELASRAGCSSRSSAYTSNLSHLASLDVLEYPSNGRVRAGKSLFPEGLV